MPKSAATGPGFLRRLLQRVTEVLKHTICTWMMLSLSIPHVRRIYALYDNSIKSTHDLRLSQSKARRGTTDLDFLEISISPAGLHPNTNKVGAIIELPTPTNTSQLRLLLGGLSSHGKLLSKISKTIRPLTKLLKNGAAFVFTSYMKTIVHELLKTLPEKRALCFPHWGAVQDGSRLPQLHTDASVGRLGAEQSPSSTRWLHSTQTLCQSRHSAQRGQLEPARAERRSNHVGLSAFDNGCSTCFRTYTDHGALTRTAHQGWRT